MSSYYNKRSWIIIGVAAITMLIVSCKKDIDSDQNTPPVQDGGVYIINEGNFQWSNGRVDYYRFADGSLSEDVFQQVNQRPLGDVVQSMTIDNGRAYIVVNNSGKVEVVDINGFASLGTISNLTSPRYLIPVGYNKAYVSDLYANAISIVDLVTLQKTGQISLHGSTEEMLLVGQTVFVTNTRRSFIYLVDVSSNAVIDSIGVGYASSSIKKDKDGKLWVLCAGDQAQAINAGLYRIDPVSRSVISSFSIANSLDIWNKLAMNGSNDQLFFLDHGVWKLDITAASLPSSALISEGSAHFYGLGVDPSNGNIYVSDAIDYVQKGLIYRYTPAGNMINSLNAGIIPSGFCFD